ncbi:NUDIX hydrolase [Streptomyces sp. NPDC054770]
MQGDYRLGATCVAFDPLGRVLILRRRSPQRWELPGGLVEPGEGLHAAAERETLEETGVWVRVGGLVGIYQHPSRKLLVGVFVAQFISGEPQPTSEASTAVWESAEVALERLHPLYRPRLEDVLTASHTSVLRVHEGVENLARLEAQRL